MSLFFSNANAEEAAPIVAGSGGQDLLLSYLPLILIFVIFYFLLIRPEVKKRKEHANMIANLKRGMRVIFAGGIVGTIAKIDDEEGMIQIEVTQNVKIKVLKNSVIDILPNQVSAEEGKTDKVEKKLKAEKVSGA